MRKVWILAVAVAGAALMSACAPGGDSGVVALEPMTPQARSERDVELTGGAAPASAAGDAPLSALGPAASGPGSLGDDATFTGDPSAGQAASPAGGDYDVVAPRPVPERPRQSAPSVVDYALAADHAVGTALYSRSGGGAERAARSCARYASPTAAQQAFLSAGGPGRDPGGLDPDGDGYACGWTPAVFRDAVDR